MVWLRSVALRRLGAGVDALISVLQCRLVPRSQYLRRKFVEVETRQ